MVKQNEVTLKNAILENVMRYLSEKLKGISGKMIEQTHDDGTILMYCIQNPRLSFPIPNKIEVEYTTTVTPKGDMEKAHGYWGSLNAMRFEGMQLQTNTVLVKAECNHPIVLSDFDRYWADMLKDFGADTPTNPKPTAPLPATLDEFTALQILKPMMLEHELDKQLEQLARLNELEQHIKLEQLRKLPAPRPADLGTPQPASIDPGHEISGIFILPVDWDVLVSASHSCLDGYAPGFVEKEIITNLPASITYRIWQEQLGELGTVEIRKLGKGKSQIDISGVPLGAEKLPDWEQTAQDLQGKSKEIIHKALADKDEKLKAKRAQMKNHQANVIRAYFSRLKQEQIWQDAPEPAPLPDVMSKVFAPRKDANGSAAITLNIIDLVLKGEGGELESNFGIPGDTYRHCKTLYDLGGGDLAKGEKIFRARQEFLSSVPTVDSVGTESKAPKDDEAITEKIRKYLNPGITDDELLRTAKALENIPADKLQIPAIATGTLIPYSVRFEELEREREDAKQAKLVALQEQILAELKKRPVDAAGTESKAPRENNDIPPATKAREEMIREVFKLNIPEWQKAGKVGVTVRQWQRDKKYLGLTNPRKKRDKKAT